MKIFHWAKHLPCLVLSITSTSLLFMSQQCHIWWGGAKILEWLHSAWTYFSNGLKNWLPAPEPNLSNLDNHKSRHCLLSLPGSHSRDNWVSNSTELILFLLPNNPTFITFRKYFRAFLIKKIFCQIFSKNILPINYKKYFARYCCQVHNCS